MNIFTNSGKVALLVGNLGENIRLETYRDQVTRTDNLYIVGVRGSKETNVVKISMSHGKEEWDVRHVPHPREGEEI